VAFFTARSYTERCLSYGISVYPSITQGYCVQMMMPSLQMDSQMTSVSGDVRFINIFARDHP